jgi:hypothetical protein
MFGVRDWAKFAKYDSCKYFNNYECRRYPPVIFTRNCKVLDLIIV